MAYTIGVDYGTNSVRAVVVDCENGAEKGACVFDYPSGDQGILLDKFDPENPPTFDAGDHRKDKPKFAPEALRALKPKMALLKERFGATTEDLAAVALRYVLDHPHVACVIPGFRNERQVACNLTGAKKQLTKEDREFVAELFS